jgi:hypothetical protein
MAEFRNFHSFSEQ